MSHALSTSKSNTDLARADATDEELLITYRDGGDVEAFEELVHRYEKPIYNYLLRYLRNRALVDDVFQATFLRLHEKCDQYHEDQRFRPWLYSIATHRAIDAFRKEKRHQAASLDEEHAVGDADTAMLLRLLESATPSPIEQAEEHERAEWTREAVDSLKSQASAYSLVVGRPARSGIA